MTAIYSRLSTLLYERVSIAPLVIFRILFGALLLYMTTRTADKGWIEELYIDPTYHFSFFSWLQPLDSDGMHAVFTMLAVSAVGIMIGCLYRLSTVTFFTLFLYVELLDKTYYLNHYYLVTLIVFWLMMVPSHRHYSVDAWLRPSIRSLTCSRWHILIFQVQLSIVYFFAGVAKINGDWLLRAQPLATWLPGRYEIPLIGSWLHYREVAFLFSWMGCLYDTTIWIFLWMRRTRWIAYVFVLGFHILTGIIFPRIGMFPYIMIVATVIFFSTEWHERVLSYLPFAGKFSQQKEEPKSTNTTWRSWVTTGLMIYLVVQFYLPLRHWQYDGNLFWHEQGYRFSWRVMLMEKNGYTSFVIHDPETDIRREVDVDQYLTPFQKQQMRSQPDMIYQFAHFLGDEFAAREGYAPRIHVDSRMSLNGRRSQSYVDFGVDLYALDDPQGYFWILPFER